jgi:hypothetical protein
MNTQPHLKNNPGVRGHSASRLFAATGCVHVVTLDKDGKQINWLLRPNGVMNKLPEKRI